MMTERSALARTAVFSLFELLVPLGSCVTAVIVAVFVRIVPPVVVVLTCTVTARSIVCSGEMPPSAQVTLLPERVPPPVAETNVTPGGKASVTTTLLAAVSVERFAAFR